MSEKGNASVYSYNVASGVVKCLQICQESGEEGKAGCVQRCGEGLTLAQLWTQQFFQNMQRGGPQ